MTIETLKQLAAVAALFTLASCAGDEMLDPLANGPVPMSFVADIDGVGTRATSTGFSDGTFNVMTGIAAAAEEPTTSAPLTFAGTAYSRILLPQSVSGGVLPVTVTYDGSTYKANLAVSTTDGSGNPVLLAGTHYTYTVTVKGTGLEVGTAEIQGWALQTDSGDATLQE